MTAPLNWIKESSSYFLRVFQSYDASQFHKSSLVFSVQGFHHAACIFTFHGFYSLGCKAMKALVMGCVFSLMISLQLGVENGVIQLDQNGCFQK